MRLKAQGYIYLAGIFACLAAAWLLLGADFSAFFKWYLALFFVGLGFYPLTSYLFSNFSDQGWIFSKTIGTALSGYIVWLLSSVEILQFTNRRCLVLMLICAGVCWVSFVWRKKQTKPDINRILGEELLFLAVFFFWTYLCCFRPAAYGTEKFMDYGFMAAMDRSLYMPPRDIWYGEDTINYYYGGQFFGVYLAKLSRVSVRDAYNLLRATVGAFAFACPFSIVNYMLRDQLRDRPQKVMHGVSVAGGFLSGAAVSLAGNIHYVLYGLFGSLFRLSGWDTYWFPDSTRFIGYNPDTADKCIHEFPSYSLILGDDHAHMINIMFVLTVVAILYAWARQTRTEERELAIRRKYWEEKQKSHPDKYVKATPIGRAVIFLRTNIREPHLVFAAILIGMFQWTNFWDFVIYLTVAFFVILADCLSRYQKSVLRGTASLIIHVLEVLIISTVVGLPFRFRFNASMAGPVTLCENHTPAWQFLILWGFPLACFIAFAVFTIVLYEKSRREKKLKSGRFAGFFREASLGDRFAWIFGICGTGLIFIPEIVFVRDIYYSNGYARSNTMFKLTYQGYILFGMMMAYVIIRFLCYTGRSYAEGRVIGKVQKNNAHNAYNPDSVPGIDVQYAAIMRALQDTSANGVVRTNSTGKVYTVSGIDMDEILEKMSAEDSSDSKPASRKLLKKKTVTRNSAARSTGGKKAEAGVRAMEKEFPDIGGIPLLGIVFLAMLALTLGYFPYSVHEWFGNIADRSRFQGIDATSYLETQFPEDAAAIRWMNENISGQPIILETYGDSYSDDCKVSAMTGLPTVEGWYVHEWLWRMNPEDLNQKRTDIDAIYETGSEEEAMTLLKTYQVEYIYVGSSERNRYPQLNDDRIKSFGTVVYDDGSAYIVRVDDEEDDVQDGESAAELNE